MRDKRLIDRIPRSEKTETILNGALKNTLTVYSVLSPFIYIGLLINYASCVNRYMHYFNAPNILIYLQCVMAGGYNSGRQQYCN